jgi:hypothetical protein
MAAHPNPKRRATYVPDRRAVHRPLSWQWLTAGILAAVLLAATATAVLLMLTWPDDPNQHPRTEGTTNTQGSINKLPLKLSPLPPPKDVDYKNPCPKPIPAKVAVRLGQASEVDPVGNARTKLTIQMSQDRHALIRRQMTRQALVRGFREIPLRMKNVLDFMDLDAAGSILEDPSGEFGEKDIRIQVREIGFAKYQRGRWTYSLSSDPATPYELIEKKDSRFVTVRSVKEIGGSPVVEEMVITLPVGAHDIQVISQTGKPCQLVYQLPAPAARGDAWTARPALTLETKPHILSALYKIYGDPRFPKMWAARSAFHNTTGETLSDFQVRFRIVGYSEWSGWSRSDVVYPGQTVVDHFRPVIDAKVRDLKGATPVDIEVEYECVRRNREKVRDAHTQRTKFLGFNEGVYTDVRCDRDSPWIEQLKGAPLLLASFTAGNDPVVQEVVGKLSKTIGGASATGGDRAAGLFLKALYNLMRANVAVNPAAADHLLFLQQPTDTAAGQMISPAVTVEVVDQFGNVVISDNADTVTLAIGVNPSGGTLSGTLTVTVSGGIATFSDLSIDLAGDGYTLHAMSTGLADADSVGFRITA